jgi:hypothetical protein
VAEPVAKAEVVQEISAQALLAVEAVAVLPDTQVTVVRAPKVLSMAVFLLLLLVLGLPEQVGAQAEVLLEHMIMVTE